MRAHTCTYTQTRTYTHTHTHTHTYMYIRVIHVYVKNRFSLIFYKGGYFSLKRTYKVNEMRKKVCFLQGFLSNFKKEDVGCEKSIIISIFSSRHRLHLLSKHFGVFDFFHMDHWISGAKPLFFKLQKCLDRAVWCFRCSWEKENLWFAYLIFHFVEEIPK